MKLKIAISPCPNDIFIFSGLIKKTIPDFVNNSDEELLEFDFQFHELEILNQGAQQGKWDIVKISYANFPYCAKDYQLLRCGGALGKGCGPLLLSNQGSWDPNAEVLVPGKFTTANFLLDFYFENLHASNMNPTLTGTQPKKTFLAFDEIYRRLLAKEPCQGVVIHEMRFTYQADGLHLLQDLGENWERQMRLPIPLGAVALRRDLVQIHSGRVQKVEAKIRQSLAWALAHRSEALELARHYSQSLTDSVLEAHIDLYVNEFSRNLGSLGDQAVTAFLNRMQS